MGDECEPASLDALVNSVGMRVFDDRDAQGYSEGAQYYRQHLVRERSAALVDNAKRRFRRSNDNHLFCEACGFDFLIQYGELGDGYIECHHAIPVHTLETGAMTKVEDTVLLCANCHRMAHRSKKWLSLGDLRDILNKVE